MSKDLEYYEDAYNSLGDSDIADLLKKAASLSRQRGREESFYLDETSPVFLARRNMLSELFKERMQVQEKIIQFFTNQAPRNVRRSLWELSKPYHDAVGEHLPDSMPTTFILLPTKDRRVINENEKILFDESLRISLIIKNAYNRVLLQSIRTGLILIGDIRRDFQSESIFPHHFIGEKMSSFLRDAF